MEEITATILLIEINRQFFFCMIRFVCLLVRLETPVDPKFSIQGKFSKGGISDTKQAGGKWLKTRGLISMYNNN